MSTAIITQQSQQQRPIMDSRRNAPAPPTYTKYHLDQGMKSVNTTTTSLLDVIRTQGPSILGAQDRVQPLWARQQQVQDADTTKNPCTMSAPLPTKPKSKPIRIDSRHHRHHPYRHYNAGTTMQQDQDHQDHDDEEEVFSNSAELERFYDQATWRMYILIQSARIASNNYKNATAAADTNTAVVHHRVPTTPHSQAPYHYHHYPSSNGTTTTTTSPFLMDWTTQAQAQRSSQLIEEQEEKEDIFDLEL